MKTIQLAGALALSSSLLFGASSDDKVINFIKKSVSSSGNYSVKNIKVKDRTSIKKSPGWKAYFLTITLHAKKENRDIKVGDIVFSNGKLISKDMIDIDEAKSIKNEINPPINPKLYDKKHFIAGDINAKNRLIIFSDPVCPFCIDYVPDVIDAAIKYPKTFAVYYYDFPLPMHKSAMGFAKAMNVAEKMGIKNAQLKTYENAFDANIASEDEILKIFNKALKTNITKKQMNEKWVLDKIANDTLQAQNLMINGTPTVFVNGEKDSSRKLFYGLLKSAKSAKK